MRELLDKFKVDCEELFNPDHYIPASRINVFLEKYEAFRIGKSDESLLCRESISQEEEKRLNRAAELLEGLEEAAQEHNDAYLNRELEKNRVYFDNILKSVDPHVKLDDEQRRAILTEEDYCLVIAGAGAGKTTTMAAKVRYLVEKRGVKPEEIMVISYTNKAIEELKERINDKLNIPVPISTFHKFGYDLLRRTDEEPPSVSYSSFGIILDYLKDKVFESNKLLRKLVLFLGFYFDVPDDIFQFESLNDYCTYKANVEYETIKSRVGNHIQTVAQKRSKKMRTITGEFLRSAQEVHIANFLYLNSLEYVYEKPYPHSIKGARKMYTPDFFISQGENTCYLEHFGISQNFQSDFFNASQLNRYKKQIITKRKLHQYYTTDLIETWSEYNDGQPLVVHLKEELEKQGFILKPRDNREVYDKLVETGKDKYVWKLIRFTMEFIEKYKTSGYDENGFAVLREKTDNVRTLMYLDIAEEVYRHHQKELKKRNQIDFADMINDAEKMLNEMRLSPEKPSYKYLIIDEFQDIARQRFNLTRTLADVTGANVVAVGDDWQSIFAFAGSDITLFQRFLELMGDGTEMQITHTYRNSQQLIDIAGEFIQKNPAQIKKRLISPKKLEDPVYVVAYEDAKDKRKNWVKALETTVAQIVDEFGFETSMLMIGRYNFDMDHIAQSDLFSYRRNKKDELICHAYPKVRITFLTAHSSKGLGFDNVILVNMQEEKFGFPSQLENDPILKLVTYEENTVTYAEERRLFYVALTRTKNRVYMVAPRSRPSSFVLELIRDYQVPYDEELSLVVHNKHVLKCPVCEMPLKYEFNKNYGIHLYICTNEPEICDFMTNDRLYPYDIFKCPVCDDGYMIVKKPRDGEKRFYGCTNFRKGKGCRYVRQIKETASV